MLDAAAQCLADPRNPLLITHDVSHMLRQRVYGLTLGWEDLNDHGALRCDVSMQTAVGVEHEVTNAPTLCWPEKWADQATAWRLHQVLVEQIIATFKTDPKNGCSSLTPPTIRCTGRIVGISDGAPLPHGPGVTGSALHRL